MFNGISRFESKTLKQFVLSLYITRLTITFDIRERGSVCVSDKMSESRGCGLGHWQQLPLQPQANLTDTENISSTNLNAKSSYTYIRGTVRDGGLVRN